MSLFIIPRKVKIRLERNQTNFLWGDLGDRRKIHLVKWSDVCKAKNCKGLGLRRLNSLNQALLGKWLWRFSIEHESLWRKILYGKFGELEGGWTTRVWRDSFGMSLWKDIRKGWEEFNVRTSICVGNGIHTSFWWDIWVEDFKLKDVYPTFFRIASHKNATMRNYGKEMGMKRSVGRFFLEDLSKIGR